MTTRAAPPRSPFDQWSRGYDTCSLRPLYVRAHHEVLAAVARRPGLTRRVLDLGCGTGRLLRALRPVVPGARLIGIDNCAAMLAVAASGADPAAASGTDPTAASGADPTAAGGIDWIRASATGIPLQTSTVDIVTGTFSVRHWGGPGAGLGEVARVLTGAGLLVVVDVLPYHPGPRHRPGREPRLAGDWGLAFDRAGLVPTVRLAAGYGPVPVVTVVTAVRAGLQDGQPGQRDRR